MPEDCIAWRRSSWLVTRPLPANNVCTGPGHSGGQRAVGGAADCRHRHYHAVESRVRVRQSAGHAQPSMMAQAGVTHEHASKLRAVEAGDVAAMRLCVAHTNTSTRTHLCGLCARLMRDHRLCAHTDIHACAHTWPRTCTPARAACTRTCRLRQRADLCLLLPMSCPATSSVAATNSLHARMHAGARQVRLHAPAADNKHGTIYCTNHAHGAAAHARSPRAATLPWLAAAGRCRAALPAADTARAGMPACMHARGSLCALLLA